MGGKVKAKLEQIAQLSATGMKAQAVREQLGIPLGTYKRIVALQEYRERLEELLAERSEQLKAQCALGLEAVRARVREERGKTVARLLNLRESGNERVALEACRDLLDRDPEICLPKASRTAFQRTDPVLTPQQLDSVVRESDKVVKEIQAYERKQAEKEGRLAEYEAERAKHDAAAAEWATRKVLQ